MFTEGGTCWARQLARLTITQEKQSYHMVIVSASSWGMVQTNIRLEYHNVQDALKHQREQQVFMYVYSWTLQTPTNNE